MNKINWNEIEPRIKPIVKQLRDLGYETTQSCGHEMWVKIDMKFDGLKKLGADLMSLGHKSFKVSCEYYYPHDDWNGVRVEFYGDFPHDDGLEDLVLLKVLPDAHPLYFILRRPHYAHGDERAQDAEAYFYNENTCPTNWTNDIVEVVSKGDGDPHGFARFVAIRPVTEKIKELDDGFAAFFPEIKS